MTVVETPRNDNRRAPRRWTDPRRVLGGAAGIAVVATGLLRLAVVAGGEEVALPFVVVGVALAAVSWVGWFPAAAGIGAFLSVALVASPAAAELAFDLSRPGEAGWFLWALVLIAASGLVVAQALEALRRSTGRGSPAAVAIGGLLAFVVVTAVVWVVGGGGAERAPKGLDLPRLEMTDFAFGEPRFVTDGMGDRWAVLVNDTGLPHTFTAPSVGVDVYVPAGRQAVLRLPATDDRVAAYCAIGEHEAFGMVVTVLP